MSLILVNGDSFCHERHSAVDESYEQKTWAHSLGAKNIALGGCSNDRIFHSTIDYLNTNPVNVLIIGWTSWHRGWTTLSNGLNLHIGSRSAADDNLFGHNEKDHNAWHEHREFYYKKCYNEFLNFKNFLNYYLHLQQHCALKDIRFLNFMTFASPTGQLEIIAESANINRSSEDIKQSGIRNHVKILEDLISRFDKKNWINKEIFFNYQNLVREKNFPFLSDGHPGIEASQYWAKVVKDN
jgi:hypothetical protein